MPDEPVWLNRLILDTLHKRLIRDFGGSTGMTDDGLVESARSRPLQRWAHAEPDLPDLAAAYAFGHVKNHGYVDGNKRIAATAAGVFLAVNGFELDAPEPELVHAILAVANDDWGEDELAAWLQDRIIPLDESAG